LISDGLLGATSQKIELFQQVNASSKFHILFLFIFPDTMRFEGGVVKKFKFHIPADFIE
jgi:hypothetical protein